jgi:hypothetical protein
VSVQRRRVSGCAFCPARAAARTLLAGVEARELRGVLGVLHASIWSVSTTAALPASSEPSCRAAAASAADVAAAAAAASAAAAAPSAAATAAVW